MVKPSQYMSLGMVPTFKDTLSDFNKLQHFLLLLKLCKLGQHRAWTLSSYNRLGFSTWWSFPWSPGYPGGHCFHEAASLLPGTCLRTLELESFLSTNNASVRIHLSMPLTLLSVDYSRPGTGMHAWLHWSLPRWPPLAEVLVVPNTVVLKW